LTPLLDVAREQSNTRRVRRLTPPLVDLWGPGGVSTPPHRVQCRYFNLRQDTLGRSSPLFFLMFCFPASGAVLLRDVAPYMLMLYYDASSREEQPVVRSPRFAVVPNVLRTRLVFSSFLFPLSVFSRSSGGPLHSLAFS